MRTYLVFTVPRTNLQTSYCNTPYTSHQTGKAATGCTRVSNTVDNKLEQRVLWMHILIIKKPNAFNQFTLLVDCYAH